MGGLLPELQELEAGLGSAEDEEATRSRIWDNVKRLDGSFGHTGSIFRSVSDFRVRSILITHLSFGPLIISI